MKNIAKKVAVAVLCCGVALSAAAFSACAEKREPLISGNFNTVATDEQSEAARALLYMTDVDSVYGAAGTAVYTKNIRTVSDGVISMSIGAVQDGQSMTVGANVDMNLDHIITIESTSDGYSARGTGTVDFSMSTTMESSEELPIDLNAKVSCKGKTYSDVLNLYIDGNMSSTVSGETQTLSGKYKVPVESGLGAMQGSDVAGDITEYLEMIDNEGTLIYVDETDAAMKIKISFDKESWVQKYGEMLEEMFSGSGLDAQTILDDLRFNRFDLYFEYDKETSALLGYGVDVNASLNTTATIDGVNAKLKLKTDFGSWMVTTDQEAGQLPDDLDSYQDTDLGGIM